MKCDDTLMRMLKDRKIVWHPAPFDGDIEGAFMDLLIDGNTGNCLHVYTEERKFGEADELPGIWSYGTHRVEKEHSYIECYSIEKIREVCELELAGRLIMDGGNAINQHKVFSATVTLRLKDGREIVREVLLAVAESVEFALKVFLENGIKVHEIFMKGYHAGLCGNGCMVEGGNIAWNLLKSLGTETLYADDCSIQKPSEENSVKVLAAYPELRYYYNQDGGFTMPEGYLWSDEGRDQVMRYEICEPDLLSEITEDSFGPPNISLKEEFSNFWKDFTDWWCLEGEEEELVIKQGKKEYSLRCYWNEGTLLVAAIMPDSGIYWDYAQLYRGMLGWDDVGKGFYGRAMRKKVAKLLLIEMIRRHEWIWCNQDAFGGRRDEIRAELKQFEETIKMTEDELESLKKKRGNMSLKDFAKECRRLEKVLKWAKGEYEANSQEWFADYRWIRNKMSEPGEGTMRLYVKGDNHLWGSPIQCQWALADMRRG